eukprot:3115225-Rhodomonas_salina.1
MALSSTTSALPFPPTLRALLLACPRGRACLGIATRALSATEHAFALFRSSALPLFLSCVTPHALCSVLCALCSVPVETPRRRASGEVAYWCLDATSPLARRLGRLLTEAYRAQLYEESARVQDSAEHLAESARRAEARAEEMFLQASGEEEEAAGVGESNGNGRADVQGDLVYTQG